MRTLFFTILLFLSIPVQAQFNIIRKYQYDLPQNYSNAKILDLGNNHLIFITGNYSLFVSHSYDNGYSWEEPIPVFGPLMNYIRSLDAIILPSGRIVIEFYSPWNVKTLISDDNGITWSQYGYIYGADSGIKLYYSDKLYAFYSDLRNLYYSTSYDGINWSEINVINDIVQFRMQSFTFIEFYPENYIIAIAGTNSIILKKSNVLNGNWTDIGTIFQSQNSIFDIDGIKDSFGKYWLSYSVNEPLYGLSNKNIYFITSDDNGLTWSDAEIFGKSYKDDWKVRLSFSNDNPFAVFISNRNGVQNIPYYGKLDISQDIYYPPFIQDHSTHIVDDYPNSVTVIARARAFTDRAPFSVFLTYNGNHIETMYDDGQHNDGVAGDSIYGASHTFYYSEIENDQYPVGFFATNFQLSSVSLKLFSLNPPPNTWDTYILRNGNARFAVESNGIIADVFPQGYTSYDAIPVIYSAGFMMSGITNGEIWSNAMVTAERIEDYVSGTIGDTSTAVYVVKSSDPPFGESWQNWRNAVAKGAYFYDGDGDSVYNPVDLNGNGQWDENEDCPDMLGDETVWMVYNDGVPSEDRHLTDVSPQGIEIRQTVWTKYGEDLNKNVFYIRYSIVNRGTVADTLKDVYFGLWAKNEIGDYADDLIGCSIPTRSGFTYTYKNIRRFKGSAPVVMTTLLQGPIRYTGNPDDEATNNMGELLGVRRISGAVNDTMTSFKQFIQPHPAQSDPLTKEQVRYFLLGLNVNGQLIDPCNCIFGEIFGEDCSSFDGHFIYSGNPYDSTGWINIFPWGQKQMLNTGPFDLVKDQPVDIIAAYHFSKGETSLQSVQLGLEKAQELHNHFFPDSSDENENDLPAKFNLEQNYPNPFNPTTTISYVIARSGATRQSADLLVQLKVYDILGREVATLVNKKQTPGKYSVQFNGRNLASGVYFYTLQAGNFIQTKKMILIK